MKRQFLFLCFVLAFYSPRACFGQMAEASEICHWLERLFHGHVDTEAIEPINQLGFRNILRNRLTEADMRELASCYLEKILDFYSVDPGSVALREYKEGLDVIRRMINREMINTLRIADLSTREKVHQVVQEDWNERTRAAFTTSFDVLQVDHGDVLLRLLLNNGADLEIRHDRNKLTLLRIALAEGGHGAPFLVELLLEAGADSDAQFEGFSSLYTAIEQNSLAIVRALCSAGALWQIDDEEQQSILMDAIGDNSFEITWYLLAFGVRVSERAQQQMQRIFPDFPYRIFLREQKEKIVRELCLYAQDRKIELDVDQADLIASFVVSQLDDDWQEIDENEVPTIATSERMGRVRQLGFLGILQKRVTDSIVRQLAAYYLDNVFRFYSIDPLSVSVGEREGALRILSRWIYDQRINRLHIADLSSTEKLRQLAQEDWNALRATDGFFNIFDLDPVDEILEVLLKNGVDLETKHGNEGNMTFLHMAVDQNDLLLVKRLLAVGADPNAQASTGATGLHLAVNRRNLAVVEALCRAGACWDITTDAGTSVLARAIDVNDLVNNLIVTSYLLAFGVYVSAHDRRVIEGKFPGLACDELLEDLRHEIIEELCRYAHEHHLQLPVDIARLITSLVVSHFEEESAAELQELDEQKEDEDDLYGEIDNLPDILYLTSYLSSRFGI